MLGLFKSKEERLKGAILKLKDAIFYYENSCPSNTPSDTARQEDRIRKAAQRVFNLGGDPQDYVSVNYVDLMPGA